VIFGISMVRDEDDILDVTLRHMLANVDHVLIADNGSVDGTRAIIEQAAADTGRVTVVDDPEPGYYQSAKMTALAARAADMGATWVVPFDADELWTAGRGLISDVINGLPDGIGAIEADFYHHFPTVLDPADGTIIERMGWRTTVSAIPKTAARCVPGLTIEQGNHWATVDRVVIPHGEPRLVIHHYPYRSPEQVERKVRQGAAAYAAAPGLSRRYGYHWRDMAAELDAGATNLFSRWVRQDPEHEQDVIYDPPTPLTV